MFAILKLGVQAGNQEADVSIYFETLQTVIQSTPMTDFSFDLTESSFLLLNSRKNLRSVVEDLIRDGPLFFYRGGLPFLGLADNFFQRVMCFKQFFFITFCNENNFLQPFLKTLQVFL